jgi:hypothetical protein
MSNEPPSPIRVYVTSAAIGLLAAVAVGGCGVPVTVKLAGWEGVGGLAAGCGVSLVANWAGLLPVALLFGQDPRQVLTGVLAGMSIRLFLTLLLALPLALAGWLPTAAFLIWVAIGYLVILFAETSVLVVMNQRYRATDT